MAAHHVLLTQTKVGFLTGGRGRNFHKLADAEKNAQHEEAYARATVALTRAQRFCFLMCPLDMKGLVGAATVVGSLQHGSGICEQRADADPLQVALKASSRNLSQQDEDFLRHFRASAAVTNGCFPPAAVVETNHEPDAAFAKLRRLHPIIVDLLHPKRASLAEQRVHRHMMDFRRGNALNTTPLPLKAGENWRCRYGYGYDLDDSDLSCFLVLPERTDHGNFRVIGCETCAYHILGEAANIATLGLEHFYAAFGLKGSRDLRPAASRALQLDLESISEDCCVRMDVAVPYQLLRHGTPLEAQASKRARKDVRYSLTHSDIEENSSNQPVLSGSDASSSSESCSTVDAAWTRGYTKASSMMSLHRRLPWVGILLHLLV